MSEEADRPNLPRSDTPKPLARLGGASGDVTWAHARRKLYEARTAAVLFSITGSCRRLGIDPFAYLRDVWDRLPTTPVQNLPDLLPDTWFAANPRARRKTAA